jgi:hypothetical protein
VSSQGRTPEKCHAADPPAVPAMHVGTYKSAGWTGSQRPGPGSPRRRPAAAGRLHRRPSISPPNSKHAGPRRRHGPALPCLHSFALRSQTFLAKPSLTLNLNVAGEAPSTRMQIERTIRTVSMQHQDYPPGGKHQDCPPGGKRSPKGDGTAGSKYTYTEYIEVQPILRSPWRATVARELSRGALLSAHMHPSRLTRTRPGSGGCEAP